MLTPQFFQFKDDGNMPNNALLNVIFYPAVFKENPCDIEAIFNKHQWTNSWINGVFGFHHYHSNTHEVLGVQSGWALLQLGGENGQAVRMTSGDVVLLPAGTGHKKLESSADFRVVGAYPNGVSHNLKIGEPGERPFVLEAIQNTPLPKTDPVYGDKGPVMDYWW